MHLQSPPKGHVIHTFTDSAIVQAPLRQHTVELVPRMFTTPVNVNANDQYVICVTIPELIKLWCAYDVDASNGMPAQTTQINSGATVGLRLCGH